MAKIRLDDRTVRALEVPASGNRIDYDVPAPSGRGEFVRGFAIRTTANAVKTFLLVYVTRTGIQRRHAIGHYPAHTVTTAREEARKLRQRVDAGADPYADLQAAKAATTALRSRRAATFGGLLTAYIEHLKAAGKPSWRQVEAAIARHITEPRPKLAAKAADEITVDDVMPVFHALTRAGKLREAEKLRAYLRAAYTAARKARTDATMFAFAEFRIHANPLADLDVSRPKEAVQKAAAAAKERKWALNEAQLAAYWKRIQGDETGRGALLRFHLLTGGQRIEQLARLTADDLDEAQHTITLRDTKGRRRVAYEHIVPLIQDAQKALDAMRGDEGPFLFTLSAGKEAAVYHTVWEAVQGVAAAMVEAKEIDRLFTPGTIRKTVETRLQAAGVSRDVRAHLLSHGRSGVQAQHYEAHDYDDEKRAALKKLRALCEPKGKAGNVTPIRRKSG